MFVVDMALNSCHAGVEALILKDWLVETLPPVPNLQKAVVPACLISSELTSHCHFVMAD